ncbi:hypothetical protein [Shewanella algae]|uniref:hypothetical protein n=1 Tax=Shewanella algae TaxID=38313 RepID=UPI001BEF7956|nr:hypothetical protein [Shewanella algae]BCV40860.1 hypothetical protein TUM17378_21220 [Shewanella algae]
MIEIAKAIQNLETLQVALEKLAKRELKIGDVILQKNKEMNELITELFAARAHIELLHDAINKGDLQTAQMAAGEFANNAMLATRLKQKFFGGAR